MKTTSTKNEKWRQPKKYEKKWRRPQQKMEKNEDELKNKKMAVT